jgi:hypothetical protein
MVILGYRNTDNVEKGELEEESKNEWTRGQRTRRKGGSDSKTVSGSLDKKGGRIFHLLLNKRCHLLPPFLSNEPGTLHCPKNQKIEKDSPHSMIFFHYS